MAKHPSTKRASTATARPMSAAEFHKALDALGLSVYAGCHVIGVSIRQAQRYSAGEAIPAPVRKLLRVLLRHKIPAAEVLND